MKKIGLIFLSLFLVSCSSTQQQENDLTITSQTTYLSETIYNHTITYEDVSIHYADNNKEDSTRLTDLLKDSTLLFSYYTQDIQLQESQPYTLDYRIYQIVDYAYQIHQANSNVTILFTPQQWDTITLDSESYTITSSQDITLSFDSSLVEALIINALNQWNSYFDFEESTLTTSTMTSYLLQNNNGYYSYAINDGTSDVLSLSIYNQNTIIDVTSEQSSLQRLILISNNPIAISLVSQLIDQVTLDQATIIIDALAEYSGDSIYKIYQSTSISNDYKLSVNDHYYSWDKDIDAQVAPIN